MDKIRIRRLEDRAEAWSIQFNKIDGSYQVKKKDLHQVHDDLPVKLQKSIEIEEWKRQEKKHWPDQTIFINSFDIAITEDGEMVFFVGLPGIIEISLKDDNFVGAVLVREGLCLFLNNGEKKLALPVLPKEIQNRLHMLNDITVCFVGSKTDLTVSLPVFAS